MSFPKYPEYKDSGIEWLGEVPAHWDITIGKRLFSNRKERASEEDEQLSATQRYGVVPQSQFMESEQQKVTLALSGTSSFRHVEAGDFVISLRSFQGGVEISNYSGCVSPAYTVMKPADEADGAYFKHLLKSYGFISILNVVSDGIRDGKTISYEQFSSVAFPVPPENEQRLVASFLDHETARIDALVEQQQRLIELLKEKRQAVISHAVTRGLNPDVPMKDSGVEWLGAVPAHWDVKPLKRLAEVDNSGSYGVDPEEGGITLPVATTAQIDAEGRFDVSRMPERGFTSNEVKRYGCNPGDVLIVKSSGSAENIISGKAGLVREDTPKFVFSNFLMRLRVAAEICTPKFLFSLVTSHLTRERIKQMCSTTTYPNLQVGLYSSAKLPCPPAEEQEKIENFLDHETARIDALMQEGESVINLLQERRSALISAAVTGKIDVRGWQPPAGSSASTESTKTEAV